MLSSTVTVGSVVPVKRLKKVYCIRMLTKTFRHTKSLPKHRHLSEISEQLDTAAFEDVSIQFCPHLAPIDRGIHTTIVVPAKVSIDTIYGQWEKVYGEAPFVNLT